MEPVFRSDMSQRKWVAIILVLTQLILCALSWGDNGHYAVCKIAQGYFEEETVVAVKKLLPESANGELAAICSWPDEIKKLPQWRWTSALHFSDTPDNKCNYEYSRDCPKDWCVAGAIFNYTYQLKSASVISQVLYTPLHEGFLGDLGGNRIRVKWYNHETNLHRVWDTLIIESALGAYYNSNLSRMIQALEAKLKVQS